MEIIILIGLLLVGTLAVTRMVPMRVAIPEDHRAYEWDWKAKHIHMSTGKVRQLEDTVQSQVTEKLSGQRDEEGEPLQFLGTPEILSAQRVNTYRVKGIVVAYDYEVTVRTKMHGHFTKSSIAILLLAILYKCLPLIIAGVIAILVLDRLLTLADTVRDITTDYVVEEEYLVDENGNLVLDDEGNPVVVKRKEYNQSLISEWLPWVFGIVAIIAGAIILSRALPLFGRGRRA